MTLLNFPIGNSDFKNIRQQGSEYIDKSGLIVDLLRDSTQVLLFPRPRRFGKTLNLSTLRYFFDNRASGADLFKGLMIEKTPEFVKHQGRYPVIFVSFKDIKYDTQAQSARGFQEVFGELYAQHHYLLDSPLSDPDRAYFKRVFGKESTLEDLKPALMILMRLLSAHYQEKVVVLLDEYDTPIHSAHLNGYYDEMVGLMRALMGAAFKDNPYLFKGVITGILRVSKEGMFSGLNNIDVCSLLSDRYAQYFGFTQAEIDVLLEKSHQPENRQLIRDWYNGFQFGNCEIYNPWSIIQYFSKGGEPQPYWVGTSDNALVKQILAKGSGNLKAKFEQLIRGESIEQSIDEYITFPSLFENEEVAWSLLLFSGYLKVTDKRLVDTSYRCVLKLPNLEIKALFNGFLKNFFDEKIYSKTQYHALLESLVEGDSELFGELLEEYLLASLSYFDIQKKEPERFYHGFVLGLLVSLKETHQVRSNQESGYGRYDVMIVPNDKSKWTTIIEFKVVRKPENLEKGVREAFEQIEQKGYAKTLSAEGFNKQQIFAIVFCGKQMVLKAIGEQ